MDMLHTTAFKRGLEEKENNASFIVEQCKIFAKANFDCIITVLTAVTSIFLQLETDVRLLILMANTVPLETSSC